MSRLLHQLLSDSAAKTPDAAALLAGNESISYQALQDTCNRYAAGLQRLDIKRFDRVAIYLPKQTELVFGVLGTSLVGGIFVPINPLLKAPQVAHILQDCEARLLITSKSRFALLKSEFSQCKSLRNVVLVDADHDNDTGAASFSVHTARQMENFGNEVASPKTIDVDVASILYTSGSTGSPKGVVLSHRNMVCGAESVASYLHNTADDVLLAVLPFSFDAGFSQLTTGLSVGASVVLLNYLLPKDVIRAAQRYRATAITGVPPLWNQLASLEWPESVRDSLRYIANTGGAMPTTTLSALRTHLPRTDVYLMYGLTESFRSSYLPPEQVDKRPTSMGKAIPNAELLVVNESGELCGPGEPGELVHRGALVSLGYWNDPERTAERFRPLPSKLSGIPGEELAVWSGDVVKTDEEGYLYFIGRRDDMIKSSGYRISPTEVEDVVYQTKLVEECAAIGLPHPTIGQSVVVVCHPKSAEGDVAAEIIKSCKQNLPAYMVPEKVVCRESLPRNPNGKIDRRRIANELQSEAH